MRDRRRWLELSVPRAAGRHRRQLSYPLTMRSVRETDTAHEALLTRYGSKLPPVLRTQGFGYVFGPVAVLLVTVLLELLLAETRLGNASTIYALVVLVTAALYGRTPALLT